MGHYYQNAYAQRKHFGQVSMPAAHVLPHCAWPASTSAAVEGRLLARAHRVQWEATASYQARAMLPRNEFILFYFSGELVVMASCII